MFELYQNKEMEMPIFVFLKDLFLFPIMIIEILGLFEYSCSHLVIEYFCCIHLIHGIQHEDTYLKKNATLIPVKVWRFGDQDFTCEK